MFWSEIRTQLTGKPIHKSHPPQTQSDFYHIYGRRFAIGVGLIFFFGYWLRILFNARGDFKLHWLSGSWVLSGKFIYFNGHNHPYPPFWSIVHAPLALLPMQLAQLMLYPLALMALLLCLGLLRKMTERDDPLTDRQAFWVGTVAVLMSSRFLVRDLYECGVNLALVALSWLAVYLWQQKRDWLGGLFLGLAMSLKCTPALFWAYFLYKRQWKMALATLCCAICFSLSPMIVLGPQEFFRAGQFWFAHASRGLTQTDPSQGVLGPEQLQNISLRPSLARFLMHLPDGHPGRFAHPLYADFLDLTPFTAGLVIKLVLLGMVCGIGWQFRRKITERDNLTIMWECAIINVLILLYSPITWGQHCVGVLPLFYLLSRSVISGQKLPTWANGILCFYFVTLVVLNREVIGKQLSWLMDSYHVTTFCIVGLLAIGMSAHRKSRQVPQPRIITLRESSATGHKQAA